MRHKLILFYFICLLPIFSFAGVKDFDRKISFALVSVNHNYSLGLDSGLKNVDTSIDWKANTASLSGAEISYKGLTLAYLSSNGFTEEDISLKGETSYEDIRGGLFFGGKKEWVFLGYYNRYKGFYLDNTKDIDPTATTLTHRDDIETFNSGAGLMYIFNPSDFSAAAAYVQSAQQTDSGGSWLLMLSFDINLIKAETDLIPDIVEDDFGPEKDFNEGRFATTTLALGYAYTLEWNKFFVNLTALIGRGFQQKNYQYGSTSKEQTANSSKFAMGYSLGYNGDYFYAGLSYVQDDNDFSVGSVRVSPLLNSNRIFLGIRF